MVRSVRIARAAWLPLLVVVPRPAPAAPGYRFADVPPVLTADDMRPIPAPHSADFSKAFYFVDVTVRRPAVHMLQFVPQQAALDVNALDDVPQSSWFTPRLGARDVSPEELVAGPSLVGPPQLPIRVLKAKPEGNPGFVIADARGKKYIVKFDPPEFPGIETTTDFIVNRLFWAFGYNVPEDFTVDIAAEDFVVAADGRYTQEDVDQVLRLVAPPVGGRYRATASLLIEGAYLGPTMDRGVRKDDPNDTIAHERRRVLRALRVFGAFVNHSDMRVDNAGDFYQGEPGRGHVQHYLLDFGEAFGGHGAEHDYLWDGFEHYFSYGTAARNLVTLGLDVQPWESIQYTRWKSVGAFESQVFDPQTWKETYPYEPIRRSQPADEYWAAKILARLTREQLQAVVGAAQYPEPGAADYVVETLWQRRAKVLAWCQTLVAPIEAVELMGEELRLEDQGKLFGPEPPTRYEIRFQDAGGREIRRTNLPATDEARFAVAVPAALLQQAHGYLRVLVWVWRGETRSPSAAQFHLRAQGDATPRLVGVVH